MDVRAVLARVIIEITSTTELQDIQSDVVVEFPDGVPQNLAVAGAIYGARSAVHELVETYEREFGAFGSEQEVDLTAPEE